MTRVEQELEACRSLSTELPSGIHLRLLFQKAKRPRVAVPVLVALLGLAMLSAWWFRRLERVQWARDQVLPRIAQLINQDKAGEAYDLALQAERYIPNDPKLRGYWPDISWPADITTTPPGVSVFRRNYNAPDSLWQFVGRSPIEKTRVPLVDLEWKFELKGFATEEHATTAGYLPEDPLRVKMAKTGAAPAGMVHLVAFAPPEGRPVRPNGLAGYEDLPAVRLREYWIDRYEVSNAEFKRFLDRGGYQNPEYWKQEFRKDGRVLSWAEAMALFRDRTGMPGPATWVQGEYPQGQQDFPVTGVSWFEAAAFAEFAGKRLPTIYHWSLAAGTEDSAAIIPASNFGGPGPARVGSHRDMSWSGAYDMAGNVKEWCFNEANSGKRFIMGGAWDEPAYMFFDADARSPFERAANFGFRTAKYVSAEGAVNAEDPIRRQVRNFTEEKPVSDRLFQAYKSFFSYDKAPLQAVVESSQEGENWTQEKVTFAAAYGNERVTAYLFVPKKGSRPFQTVIYAPGAAAFHVRSSLDALQLEVYDFIIKSGRAVMFPLYKSTYERADSLKDPYPKTSNSYRDHVIAWSKDLARSIDYLETRPEIDSNKLGYEGYSWGAAMGSLFPALESRLKVNLLIGPGFFLQKALPEVDLINFAPRVKIPVLMLNGRFDYLFPVNSSQEPMFRLLGTPKEQKRRVLYDAGHDIARNEMIKECLAWLDRYLGPVK